MQKLVNTLRKKSGYVSVEIIIVAGLLIGLGALSISSFQTSANKVTSKALQQVEDVQDNYDGLTPPSH